jgi:hypothetical protein
MDPALQQQLAEYLKAILATAQSGAAFVSEQAPLVVQERLVYGRITETLFVVLMCSLFIPVGMAWWNRRRWEEGCNYGDKGSPTVAITLLTCIVSFLVFMSSTNFVKVWFAPRLYVLEWAMGMVNGK